VRISDNLSEYTAQHIESQDTGTTGVRLGGLFYWAANYGKSTFEGVPNNAPEALKLPSGKVFRVSQIIAHSNLLDFFVAQCGSLIF